MPDSLVLNSGHPLVSAAPPVTIPFSGTTLLQAGQAYWIGVAEIGGSVVMWNDNAAIDLPFTTKWRRAGETTWNSASQGRPGMQIYGTVVPGPGGLAMVLGGAMRGRRRRV